MSIAALLPNGEQTFVDANGVPLAGGWVYFWVPNTTTDKDTWQDRDHTDLNSNPVHLDAAGRAIIYGIGEYRQVVKDLNFVLVWDELTEATSLPDLANSYDLPVYFNSKPSDGETFPIYNVPRDLVLPAGLIGSLFTVAGTTLPTGTATFTLYKNGVSIGTIAFSITGVVTVTFASQVSFAAGDQFSMIAPSPQDATMNFVAMTFVFTVP